MICRPGAGAPGRDADLRSAGPQRKPFRIVRSGEEARPRPAEPGRSYSIYRPHLFSELDLTIIKIYEYGKLTWIVPAKSAGTVEATVVDVMERIDPTTVKVDIGIAWSDFEQTYQESIRKVGESVKIRGFRKGKVPVPILEKLIGRDVMMEAAVDAVEARLKDLVRRENLIPVKGDFEIRENVVIDDRSEVRYSKELEVYPSLDALTFDDIHVEAMASVDESRVEAELRRLAARKAPVAARDGGEKAGEFDIAVVSGRVEFEDSGLAPVDLKDERIDLAPWSPVAGELTAALAARAAGDKVEARVMFPPSKESMEPAPARLTCVVTAVLGRAVPPIDDELARDYDFKTLSDMRKEVREQLEQDVRRGWINASADRIIQTLVDKLDIPLPRSYRAMVEERVKAQKGSRDDLQAMVEKEFKKLILIQVIAHRNDLHISMDDLRRNLESLSGLLQRTAMDESKRKDFMRNWLREYETAEFFKLVNTFIVDKVTAAGGKAGARPAGADGAKETGENASK